MGRQRALAGVAVVSVLSTSAVWFIGSRISSPDEARAKTKEPKASLITVPVERRALSSNVVVRGDLAYDESTPVLYSGGSETKSVVTKAPPEVGTELGDGQIVAEVSGRPVFALQGDLPVFRTLTTGVIGDDVEQLEAALARLGFNPGPVDGTFDASTATAVSSFYTNAGYPTLAPTKEATAALTSAQEAATSALRSLREAEKAAKEGSKPLKTSERLSLENTVAGAKANLEQARAGASSSAKQTAAQIAALNNELQQARSAKSQAEAVLTAAQVPGATDPDTSAPYLQSKLTELLNAVATANTALLAKQADLDLAVATAGDTAQEKTNAIAEAERGLQIAQVSLLEALKPSDGTDLVSSVADAQRAVSEANKRVVDAQTEVGVKVPLGEVVFIRALPRRINEVHLTRGDTASGKLVTISGADLKIRSFVSAADRTLLTEGTKVKIDEDNLDYHFEGVISSVATTPGEQKESNDSGGGEGGGGADNSEKYRVVIIPGELPDGVQVESLAGVNFKITVPVKSTEGEVLAVPVAALSASGDGQTRVEVETSPGKTRFVSVSKGLAAQGFVEVSAEDGELEEGDQVVVGSDVGG